MGLSKEAVKEFQEAYYKDFNEKLSYEDAEIMMRELLVFLRWLITGSDD